MNWRGLCSQWHFCGVCWKTQYWHLTAVGNGDHPQCQRKASLNAQSLNVDMWFGVLVLLAGLNKTPCDRRCAPKPPKWWHLSSDAYNLSDMRKQVSSVGQRLFSVSKMTSRGTSIFKDQTTVQGSHGWTSLNETLGLRGKGNEGMQRKWANRSPPKLAVAKGRMKRCQFYDICFILPVWKPVRVSASVAGNWENRDKETSGVR